MLPCEILQLLRILLLYLYNVEFDVNPPPPRPLIYTPPLVNGRFSNIDFIIFQNSSTTDNFCTDDSNTPLPPPLSVAAKKK